MIKESTGYPLLSISPLGTKVRDGLTELKAMLTNMSSIAIDYPWGFWEYVIEFTLLKKSILVFSFFHL